MKRSPKLPAFSGRCKAKHLKRATHYRTLGFNVKPSTGNNWLLGLLLLLGLAGLTRCAPARTVPAEAHATSAEHAAPHGRYEWHNGDD